MRFSTLIPLLCSLFAPYATSAFIASANAENERPNFLFILVDDQSPLDLSIYNADSSLKTPNIDRLASAGMVFEDAYHMGSFSGAVCMPSRHMIMSGRSVWHLPTSPRHAETCPEGLEQQTIPAVFNRAGYATMRTCKNGNSYEAANKLFTVRHDATKRGGTAETGSPWHGDRVIEYLEQRQADKETKPFFIYFGLSHPHDTRDGTPEMLEHYGATNHTDADNPPPLHSKQPRLPRTYLTQHPFDTTHSDVRDEIAVSGVWKHRDEASIRNEIGRQFACSEYIDVQIGRVLAQLEATGELENTYIVYTADHGMSIGRHGLMGKQNLYQHTWRVPLVVSGPGVQAGERVLGNVYLMDLLATFCDLANVEPPETNEGLSFREVLNGTKETVRDVMVGVYSGGDKPGMRCVKQGDWKLIEYESADKQIKHTQLFNLSDNPNELLAEHADPAIVAMLGAKPASNQVNLATDTRYADKLAEMQALLLAEMRRLDDPYRLSNQPQDDLPSLPTAARKAGKKNTKP
jgi:arylsulfatase A-like enzyme